MSAWLVRQEGSPTAVSVPSEADVLAGLRDGNWLPDRRGEGAGRCRLAADRVAPDLRGGGGRDRAAEAGGEDETHLDMNPLIDVCLVLLIFFILTITYASLERAIDVPQRNPDRKGRRRSRISRTSRTRSSS